MSETILYFMQAIVLSIVLYNMICIGKLNNNIDDLKSSLTQDQNTNLFGFDLGCTDEDLDWEYEEEIKKWL